MLNHASKLKNNRNFNIDQNNRDYVFFYIYIYIYNRELLWCFPVFIHSFFLQCRCWKQAKPPLCRRITVHLYVSGRVSRETSPVSRGSVVHLEGQCVSGCWRVEREQGFLIVLPDVLISGTSISNSIRCMRRAVLSDMFKVSACRVLSSPGRFIEFWSRFWFSSKRSQN